MDGWMDGWVAGWMSGWNELAEDRISNSMPSIKA